MSRRAALFLDRDGVINEDHAYVHRPDAFDFIPGIFDLVAQAKRLGLLVVVVTNQAGIGRGYYTEQDFLHLMEWVGEQFALHGGALDAVYFCPDHPVHGIGPYLRDTPMRKPGPGMIQAACRDLDIDPARSVLIGDQPTDLQAGIAADVGSTLLYRPHGLPPGIALPDASRIITSLAQALPWLRCAATAGTAG